jgi:hypothetical protein
LSHQHFAVPRRHDLGCGIPFSTTLHNMVHPGVHQSRLLARDAEPPTNLDCFYKTLLHRRWRRIIRRDATYGPQVPEDAPEDGVERGPSVRSARKSPRCGKRGPQT